MKTPATAQVFVWDAPLAASLLRQNSGLVATARFRSVVRSSAKRLAELSAQPARTAFQLSDAPILSADAPLHSRVESVLQSSAELKLSAPLAVSKVAAPHLWVSPSAALRSVLARRDAPNLAALQALCPASALAIPAQCVSSKSPRNGPALGAAAPAFHALESALPHSHAMPSAAALSRFELKVCSHRADWPIAPQCHYSASKLPACRSHSNGSRSYFLSSKVHRCCPPVAPPQSAFAPPPVHAPPSIVPADVADGTPPSPRHSAPIDPAPPARHWSLPALAPAESHSACGSRYNRAPRHC